MMIRGLCRMMMLVLCAASPLESGVIVRLTLTTFTV